MTGLLVSLLAACGGSSSGPGSAGSGGSKPSGGGGSGGMADTALDAAIQQPDGDLPDGAVASSAACMTYCTCMDRHCKAVSTTSGTKNYEPGMTMAGCLSACASLSSSAITCRTTHCMNVANNPTTAYQRMHCPHAAGEAICQ